MRRLNHSIATSSMTEIAASFAVASVLTLLAIVTLALKTLVERQQQKAAAEPDETDDPTGGIIA